MATTVDVAELIDSQKVSRYQCVIAFMAWLTLFLDGVDNQSIAYVAPALTTDWDLGRGALRTVFSAGVLGVAAAMIFGVAGATAAAPAVVSPADKTPAGTTVQVPNDTVQVPADNDRCRDRKAIIDDADL